MKYKKYNLRTIYSRINMMINFKAISKLNLIRCVLRRINISKELLIIEIEQGNEVFIPKDLR